MFADGEHKFAVRGHMFAGGEHKFAVHEHKITNGNAEKHCLRNNNRRKQARTKIIHQNFIIIRTYHKLFSVYCLSFGEKEVSL